MHSIDKHTHVQKNPKHTARSIKPIKVLNVNLNSIVSHSNDLCNMVDSINPDIIVGVETKIDSSIHLGEILPNQYLENVVSVDRKRGGGGVIIAAKMTTSALRLRNYIHSVRSLG